MTKATSSRRSRGQLDLRFKALTSAGARLQPPVRGWVAAIRDALGMSTAQLATRLRVTQPAVMALQQSEAKGSIELATLRRAAAAMDCTLVYALIPNKPLEVTVRDRARRFARRRLAPVAHSMLLENQKVNKKISKKQAAANLEETIRETNPRLFWD